MMIVATEGAPPALRGRLALWLVEVRAGLYVGNYGARVREMIWANVLAGIGEGNAVIAWSSRREAGYDVLMCGPNRRETIDLDGLLVVENASDEAKVNALIETHRTTNMPGTHERLE